MFGKNYKERIREDRERARVARELRIKEVSLNNKKVLGVEEDATSVSGYSVGQLFLGIIILLISLIGFVFAFSLFSNVYLNLNVDVGSSQASNILGLFPLLVGVTGLIALISVIARVCLDTDLSDGGK
jgi:hypothetical protein